MSLPEIVDNPSKQMPYMGFVFLLRELEIPIGLGEVMTFYEGMEKGVVHSLDDLFLFGRLCFVKRVAQFDLYERAFKHYFYGIEVPPVAEGDPQLLHTKEFRKWLEEAIQKGEIPRHAVWSMSRDELMKKFWERLHEQMEAHHGGNRWIGTGGTSPFGHSGFAEGGVRVYGDSKNRSANKVVGDRRYVDYGDTQTLTGANIRQVLGTLKHMVPVGPENELDLDETIYRAGRNGGEIDLAFHRQELDRIKLVVLIDNGGTSMLPWVKLTRLLFSKIKDRFRDFEAYFFHNTIYANVYKDTRRTVPFPTEKLLTYSRETRIFVVGDASMGPHELMSPQGSIELEEEDHMASIDRLKKLRERFPYMVWLNPIPKDEWELAYGYWTIDRIRELIHMEDLTLGGVKRAVDFLKRQAGAR
jgi:uncharacterized protein with von Willebrand factor type A (vWA) domain